MTFENNTNKVLDLEYRDPRSVVDHATGWNREKQVVYFTRHEYPH